MPWHVCVAIERVYNGFSSVGFIELSPSHSLFLGLSNQMTHLFVSLRRKGAWWWWEWFRNRISGMPSSSFFPPLLGMTKPTAQSHMILGWWFCDKMMVGTMSQTGHVLAPPLAVSWLRHGSWRNGPKIDAAWLDSDTPIKFSLCVCVFIEIIQDDGPHGTCILASPHGATSMRVQAHVQPFFGLRLANGLHPYSTRNKGRAPLWWMDLTRFVHVPRMMIEIRPTAIILA